jgi:hypothetical protein
VPFRLRTTADLASSTAIETVNTYDHGATSDSSIGETTNTFTTNGFFSYYDSSLHTIKYARDNSLEVYVERILESPGAAFSAGTKESFAAIITALNTAAPNEGSVSADITFQVVGAITETQPTTV